MPSSLSDEALVQQHKTTQNPAPMAELLQRHQPAVVRACYRYVKDHDTAQDLSQEVFMRVLTRIGEFNGQSTFTTWLHSIVRNRCVDHLRRDKRKMHREISAQIRETLAEEITPDEEEPLTVEMLATWLEQLSGEDKWLLIMKYQQGWTVKQIQQVLGVSEGVIKTRLHRAKAKLEKIRSR